MSHILKFLLGNMSTHCNEGIVSYAYLISELSFTNLSYIKYFKAEKEESNLLKTKINLHYAIKPHRECALPLESPSCDCAWGNDDHSL